MKFIFQFLFSKNCFFNNSLTKSEEDFFLSCRIKYKRYQCSGLFSPLERELLIKKWNISFLFFHRRIIKVFVHFYRSFFRLIAFLPSYVTRFYSNNYTWFRNIALTDDEFQGFQWLLKSREIWSGDLDIIFFSFLRILIKYRDRLLLPRFNTSCIA